MPWDTYRGPHKCTGKLPPPIGKCGVPLLVCTACLDSGAAEAASARLLCPLCTEGYVPPSQMPTLLEAEAEPSAKRAASEPARRTVSRDILRAPPTGRGEISIDLRYG